MKCNETFVGCEPIIALQMPHSIVMFSCPNAEHDKWMKWSNRVEEDYTMNDSCRLSLSERRSNRANHHRDEMQRRVYILVMHTPFTIIHGIYSRIIFLVFSLSVSPVFFSFSIGFFFLLIVFIVVTLHWKSNLIFLLQIYTFLLFDHFRCCGVATNGERSSNVDGRITHADTQHTWGHMRTNRFRVIIFNVLTEPLSDTLFIFRLWSHPRRLFFVFCRLSNQKVIRFLCSVMQRARETREITNDSSILFSFSDLREEEEKINAKTRRCVT